MKFQNEVAYRDVMHIHDSSAVLALRCPEVFLRSETMLLDVECNGEYTRGVTIGDLRGSREDLVSGSAAAAQGASPARQPNVTVLLDVDCGKGLEAIEELLAALPHQ